MTPAARLIWVKSLERTGEGGLTCRRCGVSRPTLRKWWRRYLAEGEAGLIDRSRRPRRSPTRKVGKAEEERIVSLRRSRKLGITRLRNELRRLDGLHPALDTIHKVLLGEEVEAAYDLDRELVAPREGRPWWRPD